MKTFKYSPEQSAELVKDVEEIINNGYTNKHAVNGDQISDMFFMYHDVKDFFEDNWIKEIIPVLLNTVNAMSYDFTGWYASMKKTTKDTIDPHTLLSLVDLLTRLHSQYTDILINQIKAGKIPEA